MPFSLNGCGTRYYGRRDVQQDGSYVTTNWVSLFFVPVLPIASYRVLPIAGGYNYIVSRSRNFLARRIPLCLEQVRNVYLVSAPIMAAVAAFVYFQH
jgi:hypothetical protein